MLVNGFSSFVPTPGALLVGFLSSKTAMVTAVALAVIANLPGADAGAGAYLTCIGTCAQGIPGWYGAIICPTICAPFLLAPG